MTGPAAQDSPRGTRAVRGWCAILALSALGAWSAAAAAGAAAPDPLVHVDLRMRYYRFNKLQDKPGEADQRSSAVGGMLDLTSTPPSLGGFGLGAGSLRRVGDAALSAGQPAAQADSHGSGSAADQSRRGVRAI